MVAGKQLHQAGLSSAVDISNSNIKSLQAILSDEKLSKQILNAAKRSSKKRKADDSTPATTSPTKRRDTGTSAEQEQGGSTGPAFEESLALPPLETNEEIISSTVLLTNRAPLVLAFATALLSYTMPEQPLSSRLSLAQAVVSLNSRSKAVSIGLESGRSAEDEGWGQGQPKIKIMGRDVRVLKRWQPPDESETTKLEEGTKSKDDQVTKDPEPQLPAADIASGDVSALWGLDLEALRSSNSTGKGRSTGEHLPIYSPQSARDYLLKSFATAPTSAASAETSPRKQSTAALLVEKKRNLGLLLGALDLLYSSWSPILSSDELDRRAWQWYVRTRPDVEHGVAGWGAKGELRLKDILDLRRDP
ncbi:MAG: hypothetical protein M1823_000834 [Watsoniomyces obsoletus]|nr:MAG: hypothetical protein M1823_000834 [Watsoniomyces obsoletus]